MQYYSQTCRKSLFTLLLACALGGSCLGQTTGGQWNELVGTKVLNNQGTTLGTVRDTVIDLENGRYVGLLVSFGGFLGVGGQTRVVPAGAFTSEGERGRLYLDMEEARFRSAPTLPLSGRLGPPDAGKLAEVFHYYGQQPYFTTDTEATPSAGQTLTQLGFIQGGSRILFLPVDNLQGKYVGRVAGLRDMQLKTGIISGVVISAADSYGYGDYKYVEPQAMRYNSRHDRLRVNDHEQAFSRSPNFHISPSGHYEEESPVRPGNPLSPVIQGSSENDKNITTSIWNAIQGDSSLSHYAKTIEVGTVKGRTIVRGRVQTAEARAQIVAYADKYAGAGNVTNLLMVQAQSAGEVAIDTH